MSNYVIIDSDTILKRIDELGNGFEDSSDEREYDVLKELLSNSTPLQPQIETAFDMGCKSVILRITNEKDNTLGHSKGFTTRVIGEFVQPYPRPNYKESFISTFISSFKIND